MSVVLGGLSLNGKLIVVGAADEPLEVNGGLMLMGRRSILGWPSSSSIDSQDTLSFTYSPLVDVVSNNLAHTGRALVARGQCIEQYGAGEAYLPILDVVEDL